MVRAMLLSCSIGCEKHCMGDGVYFPLLWKAKFVCDWAHYFCNGEQSFLFRG